ncbi:oligo-1,6-glucosidase [Gottschalkiaceae bacterium SANA]|nr:oligo-1,6-glucosidase [Gottschalkiaceae bacterium SANA]
MTWWKDTIVYEIYPDSFYDSNGDGLGDLNGIREKLPELVRLGVETLWLCPIFSSPMKDGGYDVSDYLKIRRSLGSLEDFDQLVKSLKDNDMRLILDIPLNHTSDQHTWFLESKKSKKNPYRNFYIWKSGRGHAPPNNWISSKVGGSCWAQTKETDDYYLHLYSDWQPDLNWENPEVRQAVTQVLQFWIDRGVDGFRLDVINKIGKEPGLPDVSVDPATNLPEYPEAFFQNHSLSHRYIQELRSRLIGEDLFLIGQTQGITELEAYAYAAPIRKELDSFLQFEPTDYYREKKQSQEAFIMGWKERLFRWQMIDAELAAMIFFGSHDLSRTVSHFGEDRRYWRESSKALALLLLSLRGVPVIYMGEEIGMTNARYRHFSQYQDIRTCLTYQRRVLEGGEPEEKVLRDVWETSRDNARYPMHWSAESHAGFSVVKPKLSPAINYRHVNVARELNDKTSILSFYQRMINLRKVESTLRRGSFKPLECQPGVISFQRLWQGRRLVIEVNLTSREKDRTFFEEGKCLITTHSKHKRQSKLAAYEGRILVIQ